MSDGYDLALFEGAAEYYARYRPKYPKAVFDFLVVRFGLDASCRVLDLGCGTGNASLPLAASVGEIVGMDPDPGMIRVARELAAMANARNVTLLQAGSEDLSSPLGTFRLVIMGQSFHWMNRDQVLRDLHPLVEGGGGLALIGPAHGLVLEGEGPPQPKEPWWSIAETVMSKFVGERPRHRRSNPGEPRHEQALLRSKFRIAEYHEFESERHFEIAGVIGLLYSMSGNLRAQLGPRLPEFENAVREELLQLSRSGKFVDRSRTAVLVVVR
jgi:ubiquinone/menaquinone biosynthesis C-methylase UbiE